MERRQKRYLSILVMLFVLALGACRGSSDNSNNKQDTNVGVDLGTPDTNTGVDVIVPNDSNVQQDTNVQKDTNVQQDTNVQGDTTTLQTKTIKQVQSSTESLDCLDVSCSCSYKGAPTACKDAICNYNNNQPFMLKGVVVVSGKSYVNADKEGYYIADTTGGEYSGVLLSVDKTWAVTLEVGKTYDLKVRWAEFFCQTQLELYSKVDIQEVGSATPPQAIEVDASVLVNGGAEAEKWEGVLVTVKNVTVKTVNVSGNSLVMENGLVVRDDFSVWYSGTWTPPVVGTVITQITGFVKHPYQSTGSYQLVPRNKADVQIGSQPTNTKTIEAIQTDTASTTCARTGCGNGKGDFCDIEPSVKIENVVAMTDEFVVSASGGLNGFYVAEGAGSNKGILITYSKSLAPGIKKGDSISSITGAWSEVYCLTQLEIAKVEDIVKGGSVTAPAPTDITSADLAADKGEPYESVYVKITAVGEFSVVEKNATTGHFCLKDSGDSSQDKCTIELSNRLGAFTSDPANGTKYKSVAGVVRFYKKNPTVTTDVDSFYIAPISASDLVAP